MNIDIDSRIGNRTLWEWAKAMDKIDKDDKLEEFLLKYKKEFYKFAGKFRLHWRPASQCVLR